MPAVSTLPSTSIDTRLPEVVQRLVLALHPEKIILFGSHAYGQPGADSDVDLLVVMETDERPAQRIARVSALLSPRPFPVDIVVRTPGELARDLRRTDPFMHEVVEKGRILYERS
ncbi:MAG: nucleotidyltransferase domain-containing protein [Candidatus Latescibacterota bacterium]